jgi:hypothetical protein
MSKPDLGKILDENYLVPNSISKDFTDHSEIEARFGTFKKLESQPGQSQRSENLVFDPNLNPILFGRIYKYLESFYQPLKTNPNIELDVYYKDLPRVTITGQSNIDIFFNFDYNLNMIPIESIQFIEKERISNIDNKEYSFRISTSREKIYKSFHIQRFNKIHIINIRLKKRYSYTSSEYQGYFQFDLTIVDTLNIKDLLNPKRTYEFEIEILDSTKMDLQDKFKNTIIEFLVYIQDNGHLSKLNSNDDVLSRYKELQNQLKVIGKCPGNEGENMFMGLKPVSISPLNIKKISIDQNYSVTVKADGDRYLLFIFNNQLYLIDSNLKILPTFITLDSPELNDTIVDGEYILDKNLFLVFDIFVFQQKDCKQFIMYNNKNPKDPNTRYQKMQEFYEIFTKITKTLQKENRFVILKPFQVELKKYHFVDSESSKNELLSISQKLLVEKSNFKTDGLIYTPNNENYPYCGNTFEKTYKWKKPEDNTIDFLIEHIDSINQGNLIFNKYALYVSTNKGPREEFSPNLQNTNLTSNDVQFIYIPVLNQKIITIQDNIEIQNNTIIECAWGKLENAWRIHNPIKTYGWIPVRQRIEKTTQYFQTKKLLGTANFYTTANSIWASIVKPIELDQLFGLATTEKEPVYYVEKQRMSSNREQQVVILTSYHNSVKEKLLKEYATGKSIIDWSCGQGGDINKWKIIKPTSILGFDLNQQNINNLMSRLNASPIDRNIPHLFAQFNSSKALFNNDGAPIPNNWTSQKITFENFNEFYYLSRYTVGIVFFSLHYFFESEKHLNGLFWNLFKSVRKGGKCLFTFMDPDKLKMKLANIDFNGELTFSINKTPIFKFKKYVDQYTTPYGNKLGFKSLKISGISSQFIDEYIIDFQEFINKSRMFGFKIIDIKNFTEVLEPNQDLRNPALSEMLEFSNMHKVVVLEKDADQINFIELNGEVIPITSESKKVRKTPSSTSKISLVADPEISKKLAPEIELSFQEPSTETTQTIPVKTKRSKKLDSSEPTSISSETPIIPDRKRKQSNKTDETMGTMSKSTTESKMSLPESMVLEPELSLPESNSPRRKKEKKAKEASSEEKKPKERKKKDKK